MPGTPTHHAYPGASLLVLAVLLMPVLGSCRSFDANDLEPEIALKDLEGLHYASHIRVEASTLYVGMTVTNVSGQTRRLEFGDCAIHLRVYRGTDTSGTPSWRSEDWRDFQTGLAYVCLDYEVTRTLRPGESLLAPEFEERIPILDILGSTLPEDRYTITAVLELNGQVTEEIDSGEVLLSAKP